MSRLSLFVCIVLVGSHTMLVAQDAGPILTWRQVLPLRQGVALWARNTSHRPILVRAVQVTECRNIDEGCGRSIVNRTLGRGDTLRLLIVRPIHWRDPYRFASAVEWAESNAASSLALPAWAAPTVDRAVLENRFRLSEWMSPAVLEPDLDGDGGADLAVLVVSSSGLKGVALVRRSDPLRVVLLGAGSPFGNGGADFTWLDEWAIESGEGSAQTLYLGKAESAGGLVRWTGTGYECQQHGD